MEALAQFAKVPADWNSEEREAILAFAQYLSKAPEDIQSLIRNPIALHKSEYYDEVMRHLPTAESHLLRLATAAHSIEFIELMDLACYRIYILICARPLEDIRAVLG